MTKSLKRVNNILFWLNKPVKIVPQHIEKEQNCERLLQKFSTADKNRMGFRHRERSKIGKDCQHTWKDLSLMTSRERLFLPCMAAIALRNRQDII